MAVEKYWKNKLEKVYNTLMGKKGVDIPIDKARYGPIIPPAYLFGPAIPPFSGPAIPPKEYQDITDYNSNKEGYIDSTISEQDFSDKARRNYFFFIKPSVTAKQKALFVQHQKQLKKGFKALSKQKKVDERVQIAKERKSREKLRKLSLNGPALPPKNPIYHV